METRSCSIIDETLDVVIIGAGISGINAAYHIQREFPDHSWGIFEARDDIGGTWRLFQYPGIRSDSDLYTYGFSWNPWLSRTPIASASTIAKYIKESAEIYGIDKKIRHRHCLVRAEWSTKACSWTLNFRHEDRIYTVRAKFVVFATGYYDHHEALSSPIPGLEQFQGHVIHPQFWPKDYDHEGKRIVIIGSGATAITLLPTLAQKASRTTLLQRSPAYIVSMQNYNSVPLSDHLPPNLQYAISRYYWMIYSRLFFSFCRHFPSAARLIIEQRALRELPDSVPLDPHFKPKYNPWKQRILVSPDGDFFKALRDGAADIRTDTISKITAKGIHLASNEFLEADAIVTATGLKLQIGGGSELFVDERRVNFGDKLMWKGIMMQDIPNAFFMIGYTNSSWTLAADVSCSIMCRLLQRIRKQEIHAAIPRLNDQSPVQAVRLLDYDSTYVQRAAGYMPKAGDRGPWKPRNNYFKDMFIAKYGSVTTHLELIKPNSNKSRRDHSTLSQLWSQILKLLLSTYQPYILLVISLYLMFLSYEPTGLLMRWGSELSSATSLMSVAVSRVASS